MIVYVLSCDEHYHLAIHDCVCTKLWRALSCSYTASQITTFFDAVCIYVLFEAISVADVRILRHFIYSVPQASITVSQSEEGSVSGLSHTLYCTVTLVNGVSSSLVMVNWDREDSASLLSSDNITVDNELQFTSIISFVPLLNANSGQYTCSVSVTGFSESNNSNSLMIYVNGRWTC